MNSYSTPTRSPTKRAYLESPSKATPTKKTLRSPIKSSRSSDKTLKKALSKRGYDELNHVLAENVPEVYKYEMLPICGNFLDNARKLGRVYYTTHGQIPEEKELDGTWRKDPRLMNDMEIFNENLQLAEAIEKVKKENDQLRQELQILDPAMRRYDLEKQCVYLELMQEETGLLTPKSAK